MTCELLVSVVPGLERVAVVEGGVVEALHFERTGQEVVVGNVYRGRVSRVLPGMRAAFVDIGLERAGFLHMSDVPDGHVVAAGQELPVQVLKGPLGGKGPRLGMRLAIPGRYLVLLPGGSGVSVSAKITDEAERGRLVELVSGALDTAGAGYIVRTAAQGADHEGLLADADSLLRLWRSVRSSQHGGSRLLHSEPPLAVRVMRDLSGVVVTRVVVDTPDLFDRMQHAAATLLHGWVGHIELHEGERSLFEASGVDAVIESALARRVPLPSGGHLVIDRTEALVVIDVNTGGFVGRRDLEDTMVRTNLEAAEAIARQLRLRNLGGIIVMDFIDMESEESRRRVLQYLEQHLARDPEPTRVGAVSVLGLVEMTRRRTRESLDEVVRLSCPACDGSGRVVVA